MRVRSAPVLAVALSLPVGGCIAAEDLDEPSEDAALSALEQAIGFDGAIARLDEEALGRVDADAERLEARGADLATLERATTRGVLVEARSRGASTASRSTALGVASIYDLGVPKLNDQEGALCKGARLVCVRVLLAGFRARTAANAEYDDGNVGGRIDAFRHTYWNALMAGSVGIEHAKAWGDAHENGYPENDATEADRRLSDMDFHNNAEGRRLGAAGGNAKAQVREAMGSGVLLAVRYDLGDESGTLVPTTECTDTILCGR